MSTMKCVRGVVIVGAVLVMAAVTGCPSSVPNLSVPNVVGMSGGSAAAAILAAGLTVGDATEVFSNTVPAGQVISQSPEAGASVSSGSAVDLVVSKGSSLIAVPDVVGILPTAAQALIVAAGLVVGVQEQQYSQTVPLGQVMGQNPAEGALVAPGTAVDLVISQGSQGGEGEGEREVEGEPEPGTVLLPGNVRMEMVWIPAGSFMMGRHPGEAGSNPVDENPQHEVTISQGFWMGKYLVTQGQWKAVMGNYHMSYNPGTTTDNHPVSSVSWGYAGAIVEGAPDFSFVSSLNAAMPDAHFRLPTEAEWEYACRAGTTTRYYWGEDLDNAEIGNYAWYVGNCSANVSDLAPHPVGQKLPNAWGLYDMVGNIYERVQDYYAIYPDVPVTDPTGPAAGQFLVYRGGNFGSDASRCRSASRHAWCQYDSYSDIGFRVVRQ